MKLCAIFQSNFDNNKYGIVWFIKKCNQLIYTSTFVTITIILLVYNNNLINMCINATETALERIFSKKGKIFSEKKRFHYNLNIKLNQN